MPSGSGYLGVVSMFLGFVAWYRGLAMGPMPQVSQVQLVQPALSITWAAVLLGEPLTLATVAGGLAVVACVALAVRSRRTPPTPAAPERTEEAGTAQGWDATASAYPADGSGQGGS